MREENKSWEDINVNRINYSSWNRLPLDIKRLILDKLDNNSINRLKRKNFITANMLKHTRYYNEQMKYIGYLQQLITILNNNGLLKHSLTPSELLYKDWYTIHDRVMNRIDKIIYIHNKGIELPPVNNIIEFIIDFNQVHYNIQRLLDRQNVIDDRWKRNLKRFYVMIKLLLDTLVIEQVLY